MTSRQRFPANRFPFSDDLCDFMDSNQDFFNSLKLANTTRFELIPIIALTKLPQGNINSDDEVIGFFYCDKENYRAGNQPYFKQDFIVNVGKGGEEFISYSASHNNGQYVRPIREFFSIYGDNGQFYHVGGTTRWEHHYSDVPDLPDFPGLRSAGTDLLNSI